MCSCKFYYHTGFFLQPFSYRNLLIEIFLQKFSYILPTGIFLQKCSHTYLSIGLQTFSLKINMFYYHYREFPKEYSNRNIRNYFLKHFLIENFLQPLLYRNLNNRHFPHKKKSFLIIPVGLTTVQDSKKLNRTDPCLRWFYSSYQKFKKPNDLQLSSYSHLKNSYQGNFTSDQPALSIFHALQRIRGFSLDSL